MKCPECGGSVQVERDDLWTEGECAYANWSCACGATWTASYKLDSVEIDTTREEAAEERRDEQQADDYRRANL